MGVKIKLNLALRRLTAQAEKVEVNGGTVRQCLDNLVERYPVVKKHLFEDDGSLAMLVLLNDVPLSEKEMDRPVSEDDELWLINVISGG